MKTLISTTVAITFVVLATTSAFANTVTSQSVTVAHSNLSEADALRLKLALQADESKGG